MSPYALTSIIVGLLLVLVLIFWVSTRKVTKTLKNSNEDSLLFISEKKRNVVSTAAKHDSTGKAAVKNTREQGRGVERGTYNAQVDGISSRVPADDVIRNEESMSHHDAVEKRNTREQGQGVERGISNAQVDGISVAGCSSRMPGGDVIRKEKSIPVRADTTNHTLDDTRLREETHERDRVRQKTFSEQVLRSPQEDDANDIRIERDEEQEKQKMVQRRTTMQQKRTAEQIALIEQYAPSVTTLRRIPGENYSEHIFLDSAEMKRIKKLYDQKKYAEIFKDPRIVQSGRTELQDLQYMFAKEGNARLLRTFGPTINMDDLVDSFKEWALQKFPHGNGTYNMIKIVDGSMLIASTNDKLYVEVYEYEKQETSKRKTYLNQIKSWPKIRLSKLRWKRTMSVGNNSYPFQEYRTHLEFLDSKSRMELLEFQATIEKDYSSVINSLIQWWVTDRHAYFEPMPVDLVEVNETEAETIAALLRVHNDMRCLVSDSNQRVGKHTTNDDFSFKIGHTLAIKTWLEDQTNTQLNLLRVEDGVLKLFNSEPDAPIKEARIIIQYGYFDEDGTKSLRLKDRT